MGENGALRIAGITLDEHTVVRRSPDIEHERAVAIFDLLEENHFAPVSGCTGPYDLHLSIEENRLKWWLVLNLIILMTSKILVHWITRC